MKAPFAVLAVILAVASAATNVHAQVTGATAVALFVLRRPMVAMSSAGPGFPDGVRSWRLSGDGVAVTTACAVFERVKATRT